MDTFDVKKYITENRINEKEGYESRYLITFADGTDEEVGKHASVSPEDVIGSLKKKYARQGKEVSDVKHLGEKPQGIYESDMGNAVEFYMDHYGETEMAPEVRDAISDALDSGKPLEWIKSQIKNGFLDMVLQEDKDVIDPEKDMNEVIDAFGDTEMIQLKEVDYKDIYSDEALSSIQKKSEEILNKRLKGKSVSSANMDAGRIIMPILMAERQNKEYLEALAVDIVEKMYPTLFKVAPLEIDAKIVQPGSPEMSLSADSGQEELSSDNIDIDSIDLPGEKKRRVIRSITQGASIYGSESYKLFSDIIDQLDPKLVEMYNSVIDDAYGVYFQDKLESLIDSIKGGSSNQGGESEVFTEEDSNGDNTYTIKARAIIFPILVQEIIKGVYEFLSFFGMGDDPEAAQAVADKDKTEYEPEDIKNGTILYDFVKDFLIDNNIIDVDDSKTSTEDKIATFFREVMYAMEEDDMIKLADDIISGKVSSSDITNIQKLSKDIY